MATFYQGYRNVLRGRNSNNNVDYVTGTKEVYSNYSLMNSDQILEGAPDNEKVLGVDGKYNKIRILEYIYAGKPHVAPLKGAGEKTPLTYLQSKVLEYRGLTGAAAFGGTWGHADRVTGYEVYNNFVFDGVGIGALHDGGHLVRYNVSYGGAFRPFIYQGVGTSNGLQGAGQTPTDDYGHNKVNEWKGVPSAKAL